MARKSLHRTAPRKLSFDEIHNLLAGNYKEQRVSVDQLTFRANDPSSASCQSAPSIHRWLMPPTTADQSIQVGRDLVMERERTTSCDCEDG
ncbi:MAG: hypothetical protein H7274_04975 [Rhodoferax sp.]|nr:hypothetical protein [Rhodoferax sp.]